MAIAFRAAASAIYSVGSTTVTINVPTGTTNNDFMVMFMSGGNMGAGRSITTPTGWNLIDATTGTNSGGSSDYLNTYWRVASSEPASYTVNTFASGGADGGIGAILSYSGSSGTMRTHGTAKTSGTSSTTSSTPATLSGVGSTDMVVIGYMIGAGALSGACTAPGGTWNTRVNVFDNTDSTTALCIVDKINGTDTPTASNTTSGGWDVNSVAIAAISTSTGFLPFLGGPF